MENQEPNFYEGRIDFVSVAKGTLLTPDQQRVLFFGGIVLDSRFEIFVVTLWRSQNPFRCALALILSRKSPDWLDGVSKYAGTTRIY